MISRAIHDHIFCMKSSTKTDTDFDVADASNWLRFMSFGNSLRWQLFSAQFQMTQPIFISRNGKASALFFFPARCFGCMSIKQNNFMRDTTNCNRHGLIWMLHVFTSLSLFSNDLQLTTREHAVAMTWPWTHASRKPAQARTKSFLSRLGHCAIGHKLKQTSLSVMLDLAPRHVHVTITFFGVSKTVTARKTFEKWAYRYCPPHTDKNSNL